MKSVKNETLLSIQNFDQSNNKDVLLLQRFKNAIEHKWIMRLLGSSSIIQIENMLDQSEEGSIVFSYYSETELSGVFFEAMKLFPRLRLKSYFVCEGEGVIGESIVSKNNSSLNVFPIDNWEEMLEGVLSVRKENVVLNRKDYFNKYLDFIGCSWQLKEFMNDCNSLGASAGR